MLYYIPLIGWDLSKHADLVYLIDAPLRLFPKIDPPVVPPRKPGVSKLPLPKVFSKGVYFKEGGYSKLAVRSRSFLLSQESRRGFLY